MSLILKEYAKEIYGDFTSGIDQFTLEKLIETHRHLRAIDLKYRESEAAIRKEVQDQAEKAAVDWLKHGEYIHRDKLKSMTVGEIAEFLE